MPRKSAGPADTNGDVSMVSEAPSAITTTMTTSPKQSKEPKEKSSRKSGGAGGQGTDAITIDDLLLPRSIIQRIAKGVLPPNTSLQKDAILALTKSATVFISHLADSANEQTERKTIQSQDVIKALREIEFETVMQGRLEREVEVWEGVVRGKRAGYREKVKARQSGGGNGEGDGDGEQAGEGEDDGREREHENKRVRIDGDQVGREGSATGEISKSTQTLRLGVNGIRSGREQDEEDLEEDDNPDDDTDEQDEDEDEEEDDDPDPVQEHDQSEPHIAADDEEDDPASQRLKRTLAADGRVQDDNSDDDSD